MAQHVPTPKWGIEFHEPTAKFTTHCRVPFRAYCEVHNENDPSNTTLARTSQAIALNPTGNLQGSYYFMSLASGKRISRRRWTEVPFTQEVIDCVNAIALMEATYDADVPDFQFAWGNNDPIEDLDEDEDDHRNETNVVDDDNDDDDNDDGGDRPLPRLTFKKKERLAPKKKMSLTLKK
jgi:hypothetical protein